MRRLLRLSVLAVLLLVLSACGGGSAEEGTDGEPAAGGTPAAGETAAGGTAAEGGTEQDDATPTGGDAASGEPVTIGVVTSTSGLLGSYGNQYLDGLEAGLDYATDGTREVNGRLIELEVVDSGGEPEQAISAATDLVGQGVKILAGTVSSGVAVQMAPFAAENDVLYISGPAATDAITGVNDNTFRSGRQTFQDVATASTLVSDLDGANVLVFAQDSEFGAGNAAAVEAVLGGMGANVNRLLVPLNANEFTPFAQQILDAAPDLLFVAWAGDTTAAMWQALQQQGVFAETTVTTGLADIASYSTYGQDASGIEFLSHYFPDAPDNEVNQFMTENVEQPDLFTPDGFVAAQMIVQALTEGSPDDTASMISALEGFEFDAPKGPQTVRASDHALLQPMFTARLTGPPDDRQAELLETLDPEQVDPPEGGQ